jgi:glycosyltransferase involved in cell wall biosynthesis
MKITLPVHHFLPRYGAGAETYALRLAQRLIARGHDVEVVCIEAIDRSRPDALDVVRDEYQGIPVWRLSFDILNAPQRRLWDYDCSLLGDWFRDYFRRTRPDLAHFQAGYLLGVAPIQAAADVGVPSLLTLHDYWFICPQITLKRGDGSLCEAVPEDPATCAWCMVQDQRHLTLLDRATVGLFGRAAQRFGLEDGTAWAAQRRERLTQALRLPARIIAPVHFLASRYAPFTDMERVTVSPIGIDLSPFRRPVPARTDRALRFGYLGQIVPHKGVHLLVQAFRALTPGDQPLELHLYGNTEAEPAYTKRLRALAGDDARIHFRGRYDNTRVNEVLGSLDVMVTPSLWYENSPIVILESRAAGVPVVTAAKGGMAELIEDGVTGLHFRFGDARDLAAAMQRVVDDPALLQRLKRGTAAHPPRDVEDEVDWLVELYAQLAQEPVR